MEGVFAAKNKAGDTNSVPKKNYGWSLPIANSKELSDGEVVPSGFFTVSPRMKKKEEFMDSLIIP